METSARKKKKPAIKVVDASVKHFGPYWICWLTMLESICQKAFTDYTEETTTWVKNTNVRQLLLHEQQ